MVFVVNVIIHSYITKLSPTPIPNKKVGAEPPPPPSPWAPQ